LVDGDFRLVTMTSRGVGSAGAQRGREDKPLQAGILRKNNEYVHKTQAVYELSYEM